MSRQRNDILWKGLLEDSMEDLLRFVFPKIEEKLDFSKGFEFMDKELDRIFPEQDPKHPTHVDKLVKVYTHSGEEECLLIHVEVETSPKKTVPERMFKYFYQLHDRYHSKISAIALYLKGKSSRIPSSFEVSCMGTTLIYKFNSIYLEELGWDDLEKSSNPFAMALLTAKLALKKTRQTTEWMLDAKLQLARKLLGARWPKPKIKMLFSFLRRYINFENKEWNIKFEEEIQLFTKNKNTMGLLEQIREMDLQEAEDKGVKLGIRKGKKEGKLEGKLEGIQEGKLLGMQEGKLEIARTMLTKGMDIDLVADFTGLDKKQLSYLDI